MNAKQLTALLTRTAQAHHIHETETGVPDVDWASWYAAFMLPKLAFAFTIADTCDVAGSLAETELDAINREVAE